MIHHWRGLDLEITDFENHQDPMPSAETIPSQNSILKIVEIIKVLEKPAYVTSLERT